MEATSGEIISLKNPATGKLVAEVESASKADVDKAVNAAKAAFPGQSVFYMPMNLISTASCSMVGAHRERAREVSQEAGRTDCGKRRRVGGLRGYLYRQAEDGNCQGDWSGCVVHRDCHRACVMSVNLLVSEVRDRPKPKVFMVIRP